MNRQGRIVKELEKKVYANGGHWCELTMKRTGTIIKMQRQNYTSFERLYGEKFNVYADHHTDKLLDNVSLEDIANYMIENF